MADLLIDKNAESLNISPAFEGYSKVIVHTGETDTDGNEIVYSAGNTTGRTLRVTNPWANQVTAEAILERIRGWAYQPYEAEAAIMNPAAEIGDSVILNNTFSGIYKQTVRFTQLFNADLAAPHDEEIDHEYTYESEEDREFVRRMNEMQATLMLYTGSIEAKVDKISDESQSFGWRLTESGWTVFNQSGTIFSVSAAGASVEGNIKALSGKIGGFTIGDRGLYNNQSSFGGQEATGVYIGTDGIQLGTKFRVDAQGNLTAASGTFDGAVYASNIKSSAVDGYGGSFSGAGISLSSLGTPQFMQGVINSLGFADFSNDVFNKRDIADYVYAKWLIAQSDVTAPRYLIDYGGGQFGSVNTHTHYVTVSGNTVTIGAPDFMGNPHPFEIASSDVTISQNGQATYQSGYRRYAVPVVAKDSNGNVVASATLYVSASQAYDAGYNSGYSAGYNEGQEDAITKIYITSISGNSAGIRAYHGSTYQFRWVDAGDYWDGWN